MEKIRIGIAGYGNLGRGVEAAIAQNPDMELAGIFTRRDPAGIQPWTPGVRVFAQSEAPAHIGDVDVMILCGGSATDLPAQSPELAGHFHIVDSFDTHARIPEHFAAVDAAARQGGRLALISCGWDPGLFSIQRVYGGAVLPQGRDYTFWGKGVSQGHSDAIRRIEGVEDARQYTIPVEEAMERVRAGENPELSTRQKHLRQCFVALKPGADAALVEKSIKEMPNYFAEYDTTVHFISLEELRQQHGGLPHGGLVFRSGRTGTGEEFANVMEFGLKLDSNPAFTSSVLAACARAVYRMAGRGETGARTMLDVAPALLSPHTGEDLRKHWL